MTYFPVSLDLRGKAVAVIGGGEVAEKRIASLLAAGAEITVIDPAPGPAVVRWAEERRIALRERAYEEGDLTGAFAAFAATSERAVNEQVWREARSRGVLLNVADDPAHCDFIMPAVAWSGDLSIAVSTAGKSPALAARLRQRIARLIGPEYGRLLEILDDVRRRLKEQIPDLRERRRLQYLLVDSDLLGRLRRHPETVADRVEEIVRRHREGAPAEAMGMVYIVGAGPGDPGLMTLRGLECLRAADVVLHDRLVAPALLAEAAPGAEIVDVGKRPGGADRIQEEIHRRMIAEARRGRTVCRLKGGDPFVFGRGGEEARMLTEAGAPFEIVPGVTSAIAAPAAAGIPVTHRDIAHAFMVMTGSRAEKAGDAEWMGARHLLEAGGTLVILMGLAHLSLIVRRLEEAGCAASTPAAVIAHGTWPDQDARTGTLEDIGAVAAGASSPAVIVFGQVVAERERGR